MADPPASTLVPIDGPSHDTVPAGESSFDWCGPQLRRGMVIDRYVVLEQLGRGGMGVVYAAYDPELDRKIALKLLRPTISGRRPTERDRARLLSEAQAMARLSHPNVIAVHDVGVVDDQVFLAMQLVDRGTLGDWMAEGSHRWRQILDVFVQAGRGLAAAHAAGLVHRDFKPDNVLIDDDDVVRVTDFGLARSWGAEGSSPGLDRAATAPRGTIAVDRPLTEDDARPGTPAYMSPEQHRGGSVDAASDQFSFCVSLYLALFGRHPFARDDLPAMLAAIHEAEPHPPPDSPVPARIERAILRGLARDPVERWPSMHALLDALVQEPWRVRHRLALTFAAVGLLGIGTTMVLAALPAIEDRCSRTDDPITQIWAPDRRDGMLRAMESAGSAHASELFQKIGDRLDDYAQSWKTEAATACEATERGEQSGELLDLRMQCLRRRSVELGALVDVLTSGERQTIEHATTVVEALIPVEECADLERLAAAVPLPDDPQLRHQVEVAQDELARVTLSTRVARYSESKTRAQKLLTKAEALGYAPLLAEVRIETAWILEVLGELDAAEQLLYAAIEAAVEGRSAHLESRSWRQLVHLVGLERHDLSQALVLAKVARIAERRTGLDPEQPTHLDITMAAVFAHHGRFDEAIVHHERALAWSSGKPGEASALNNFGVLLVALGRRSEARRAFERGLALRLEQELADEHAIAETRQNLADLYVATGEPATALEVYAPVLAVMETAEGPHSPGVARVRSNMAVAYLQLGKFDDARREAEHALEIAERTLDQGEILAAAARISLAELDLQANALDAAAAHLVIAEEILRTTLGADHPALGEIEVGRAQLELARGSPEAARTRTAATLERLETSLGPEHADLSRVLVTLGHAELQTGQTEAATRTLERALAIFARSGGPLHEVGRCRLHLAQALNEGGKDPGRAAALFEQAEKDLRAAGRGNVVEHARAEGRLEPHPGG